MTFKIEHILYAIILAVIANVIAIIIYEKFIRQ